MDLQLLETVKQVLVKEASALLEFSKDLPASLIDAVTLIAGRDNPRVICTGMGKSGHIASKVSSTLLSTGTSSQLLHPAEALHGDLGMINPSDIILAFSNSGETEEILRLSPFFIRNGNILISIVGNAGSSLSRQSNICIAYSIEGEACPNNLAPTTSTTLSLAIGDAIAVGLMKYKSFTPQDFARYHPGGSLGRMLLTNAKDIMRTEIPKVLSDASMAEVIDAINRGRAGISLVIDQGGLLIGVVTSGDIQRAIQYHKNSFFDLDVVDVMSCSPVCINEFDSIGTASDLLKRMSVSALVVTDSVGSPVGLVTASELFS